VSTVTDISNLYVQHPRNSRSFGHKSALSMGGVAMISPNVYPLGGDQNR
jgi:hypothetical protein